MAWTDTLHRISGEISDRARRNWFDPLHPIELAETDGGFRLQLQAPSAFCVEIIQDRYAALLDRVLHSATGEPTEIQFEIESPDSDSTNGVAAPTGPRRETPDEGTQRAQAADPRNGASRSADRASAPPRPSPTTPESDRASASSGSKIKTGRLRPEYTFDLFIEGDCNKLARSAALAIANAPCETSYNPFLIYGGVGLGKTHLVQAIGNHVHACEAPHQVVYVSGEQFTSQFVRAIRTNSVGRFTEFYRQVDVLIVDDVQFFSGKEKTQEQFFHVFNQLYQVGKQIVLCADRPPPEIKGIEERLLSRFQWGLSADVQKPDLETRIAILQRKADYHDLMLPTEVIRFMAHQIQDSIRTLEGALTRLKAHSTLHDGEVSLPVAKELLHGLVDRSPVKRGVEDIIQAVADYYHLAPEKLSARSRKQPLVTARQVAMYFCRELTSKSLESIGLHFGGRDHSTVIHALKAVKARADTEPEFEREVEDIRRSIEVQAYAV